MHGTLIFIGLALLVVGGVISWLVYGDKTGETHSHLNRLFGPIATRKVSRNLSAPPAAQPLPPPNVGPVPLNPGIVKTVSLLRGWGFETVDSGDGETHSCECDLSYPYVTISVNPPDLVMESRRLRDHLVRTGIAITPINEEGTGVNIEASYEPESDMAVLHLSGLKDSML